MADDRPARQSDRVAAIRRVEAAWAAGQIVEADRDQRVEQLRHARTASEVERLVHDLRPASYEVTTSGPLSPERPAPAPDGTAKILVVVTVGIVAVLAAAGILGGVAVTMSSDEPSEATTTAVESVGTAPELPSPAQPEVEEPVAVDPRTVAGFADMLADLKAATGRTDVYGVSLHEDFAHIQAAVDGRSERELVFSWRGELEEPGRQGRNDAGRVDLRDIDMRVVERMLKRVARLVEDPTDRYVIIRSDFTTDRPELLAYAYNDWDESAYIAFEPDGTVIRRVLP